MFDMTRVPDIEFRPVFGYEPRCPDDLKLIADFMFAHDDFHRYRLELCDNRADANLHLVVTEMYLENRRGFVSGKSKKLYSIRRGFAPTTAGYYLLTQYFGMQHDFEPYYRSNATLNVLAIGRLLTHNEFNCAFYNARVHFDLSIQSQYEWRDPLADDEIPC